MFDFVPERSASRGIANIGIGAVAAIHVAQLPSMLVLSPSRKGRHLEFQHHDLNDPDRLVALEHALDSHATELIADAAEAGYSTAQVLMALKMLCERQYTAIAEEPDPAEDPS